VVYPHIAETTNCQMANPMKRTWGKTWGVYACG